MIRILCFLLLMGACNPQEILIDNLSFFPTEADDSTITASSPLPDSVIINPIGEDIFTRIQTPLNFERVVYKAGSFGYYLQHFSVKPAGSKVMLFDGRQKYRQDVHAAVLDIDVGKRDLQQCADAVMRLRAEYLWQAGRYQDIEFSFTNGFPAPYSRWRTGERIRVAGNKVDWVKRSGWSESYQSFRSYLNMIFAYAGTLSLDRELDRKSLDEIEAGDVFIQGGSPGHAVLVVDKALHPTTGEMLVLLAQSYMPAQEIHVLNNFNDPTLSPWYSVQSLGDRVETPEWRFQANHLKSF